MPSEPPARKLRLAVIGATYAFAETRKKIHALAEHFDVVCLTCESYTCYGLDNHVADQPQPDDYRLIALPAIGEPVTTTRYLLAGLGRALRRNPVDLILVESEPWAWLRWQAWLARTLWRRGAVFGEFSWENVRRPGWKGVILTAAYRAATATADFVIAGNRDAGDLFLAAGLAPDRLLVAPQLGVDTDVFCPPTGPERERLRAEMGCRDGDFLVGFCGRMEEEKGVMDLLAAVRAARERDKGAAASHGEIRLALLGPDGALSPQLAALRADHPWLRLYPARPHAGIAAFMQALDLFVLPSRNLTRGKLVWKEQFGHVLIEAMGCAVPILGSDCGAIPAVLGEGEQIFPQGDVSAITKGILALRADPARRQEIVRRQQTRLAENYTNAAIAGRWADFLRQRHADG